MLLLWPVFFPSAPALRCSDGSQRADPPRRLITATWSEPQTTHPVAALWFGKITSTVGGRTVMLLLLLRWLQLVVARWRQHNLLAFLERLIVLVKSGWHVLTALSVGWPCLLLDGCSDLRWLSLLEDPLLLGNNLRLIILVGQIPKFRIKYLSPVEVWLSVDPMGESAVLLTELIIGIVVLHSLIKIRRRRLTPHVLTRSRAADRLHRHLLGLVVLLKCWPPPGLNLLWPAPNVL